MQRGARQDKDIIFMTSRCHSVHDWLKANFLRYNFAKYLILNISRKTIVAQIKIAHLSLCSLKTGRQNSAGASNYQNTRNHRETRVGKRRYKWLFL